MTLLFTDVEGSTLIVERHGAAGTEALIRHHAIVREIAEANGGRLFERIGDAAYSVFPSAPDALTAALAIHARLASEDWGPISNVRVRTALDTGELEESEGRFFGRILYRCARIQSLAGGGETLLSDVDRRRPSRARCPAAIGCAIWVSRSCAGWTAQRGYGAWYQPRPTPIETPAP